MKLWQQYQDVDETGQKVVERDGATWRLEPGVRPGESSAGTYPVLHPLGDPRGLGGGRAKWRGG